MVTVTATFMVTVTVTVMAKVTVAEIATAIDKASHCYVMKLSLHGLGHLKERRK
jgi:hypothetical protein